MNKYCRICWNSRGWKKPTGEAKLLEKGKSFVVKYGFGHEEWLFKKDWLLKGFEKSDPSEYRYAFLQPINRFIDRYRGKTFSVLLYTISPYGDRYIVAEIKNLFVPNKDEIKWAYEQMQKNGWISIMKIHLKAVNVNEKDIKLLGKEDIINVRFKLNEIKRFYPWLKVKGDHKLSKNARYQPYDWDDTFQPVVELLPILPPDDPGDDENIIRSEKRRIRSATEGTEYDPTHDRIQNSLYRRLRDHFGKSHVFYESNHVDLVVKISNSVTFIEVKAFETVKGCTRQAIGQLLEYNHYPNKDKADRLLIVGYVDPLEDDLKYIQCLRSKYNIDLNYAKWDREKEDINNFVQYIKI